MHVRQHPESSVGWGAARAGRLRNLEEVAGIQKMEIFEIMARGREGGSPAAGRAAQDARMRQVLVNFSLPAGRSHGEKHLQPILVNPLRILKI